MSGALHKKVYLLFILHVHFWYLEALPRRPQSGLGWADGAAASIYTALLIPMAEGKRV